MFRIEVCQDLKAATLELTVHIAGKNHSQGLESSKVTQEPIS